MYVPAHFQMAPVVAMEFMKRHSFALLITPTEADMIATHIPLLFDPEPGPFGVIRGHMAKANPHSQQLAGRRSLAVFTGPHAYVSPTWYQSENTVPTWNYAAVHAYGTCEMLDGDAARQLLEETVNIYESGLPAPWSFDPSSQYVQNLAKAIVGFRMTVERIDAKAKLNQNHSSERRMRVIAELEQSADISAQEIAALMRKL